MSRQENLPGTIYRAPTKTLGGRARWMDDAAARKCAGHSMLCPYESNREEPAGRPSASLRIFDRRYMKHLGAGVRILRQER